mgnify:FL=1
MTERYFVDQALTSGRALLTGAEAHHLLHVMRAQVGQEVMLFDGSGVEYLAEVRRLGRTEAELVVLESHRVNREICSAVILGIALPKGDRQKWLIEKAVELGVSRIVPLRTTRSVAQPVRQALDRLRRTVIEASKQCGRNRLLELAEPADWQDFVSACQDIPQRYLAHPIGSSRPGCASQGPGFVAAEKSVVFAIGPEGGFTGDEVAWAAAQSWRCLDLGPRILRVETAALLLAALAAQHQAHTEA